MSPIPVGAIITGISILAEAASTFSPLIVKLIQDQTERERVEKALSTFGRFIMHAAERYGPIAEQMEDPSKIDLSKWFDETFDQVLAKVRAEAGATGGPG